MRLFLAFVTLVCLSSCESIVITPKDNFVDTTWYTIEGRYLNGTSNTPFRNIELTLKLDNYGYPRVLEEIAGPIRTDNDGYFKFRYQHLDRLKGAVFLKVYPTELYPNIDSIPLNENVYKDAYRSDYSRLILEVELNNTSDLFVTVGNSDTIYYTKNSNVIIDSLYNLPPNRTLIAWGKNMTELRDALKGKNSNQQYLETKGDPFFNHYKISY